MTGQLTPRSSRLLAKLLLALLGVTLVVVGGCGGGDDSDEEKVAAVLRDYATAMADKDPEGVCATLTGHAIQREIARLADDFAEAGEGLLDCRKLYEFAFGLFGSDQIIEAEEAAEVIDASLVEMRGEKTAVLTVENVPVVLKRTGDEWLIDRPSLDPANVSAIESESRDNLEEVYGDTIYAVRCPADLKVRVRQIFTCEVESFGGEGFVIYQFTDNEGHLSLVQYESGTE